MKHVSTLFMPEPEIELSVAEALTLFLAARHHYDGLCKQAAEPGGILWGVLNKFGIDQSTVITNPAHVENPTRTDLFSFKMDGLSLLCKIAESPIVTTQPDLRQGLTHLFRTLNDNIAGQLVKLGKLEPQ